MYKDFQTSYLRLSDMEAKLMIEPNHAFSHTEARMLLSLRRLTQAASCYLHRYATALRQLRRVRTIAQNVTFNEAYAVDEVFEEFVAAESDEKSDAVESSLGNRAALSGMTQLRYAM